MKTRVLRCLIAFLLIVCFKSASAQITYLWRGGSSGTWETPGNWSIGGFTQTILYPGSLFTNDIAVVNTSNATITVNSSHTIGQLESTTYGVSGLTLSVSSGATLTISGGFSMAQPSGASISIAFSGAGATTLGGTSSLSYQGSMSISSGSTVTFAANSTLNFTSNQGVLTNNGTLNFNSGSTFDLSSSSSFVSPGTVIGNSANFDVTGTPAFITYGGKFVANSCTFTLPSGSYLKSTSTSSAFTATTSTFNMTGSGGSAYIYNNGTYRDHGSTYNLSGQAAYLQNIASATMHVSGTTINFSTSGGSNGQYISNAGTFTADSASLINGASYQSYITNLSGGTFYAGTSNSACVISLGGQGATVTNSGTFQLGSTSIIYPTSYAANVTNNSGDSFTLMSDVYGSAAIGALSTTATCSGTYDVQRYYQGGSTYDAVKKRYVERNYRIISSPVNVGAPQSGYTVSSLNYIVGSTAGQTTGASSTTNSFITGCSGGSTTAGNPSVYVYRESITPANATFIDGNFLGVTNISNMASTGSTPGVFTASNGTSYYMVIGTGVFFFFRGAATSWSTRTTAPYIAPENVILTSTGSINQQSVAIRDWYSYTSTTLGYTGTGTGTNYAVRGFNMIGNPYPCSIDWCTAYSNTGISRTNVNPTIYEYDPVTDQYDTFICSSSTGGTATGNGSRYIASGQGFFVQANSGGAASLTFSESAKAATAQNTGSTLLMGTPVQETAGNQIMRLKLAIDTLNYDDIALLFNSSASTTYNPNEDAAYLAGSGALEGLSSFSADSVKLSINSLPLPKLTPEVISLDVQAHVEGSYTLQKTALEAVPQLYEIWLMDNNKKDSLDMRANSTYTFDVSFADTTSYGANRFKLVIRENPAFMVHLLNFTGSKVADGAQLVWTTENEENFTNFTLQRSTDGGTTYSVLGGFVSSALGTYSYLDKNPPIAKDMYRLMMTDVNGTISYSDVVILVYTNTANTTASNILVYPNPTSNMINLAIDQNNDNTSNSSGQSALQSASTTPGITTAATGSSSYGISIINITGSIVKTASSSQSTWQDSIGNLMPGTYVIQVVNNKDNSVVGRSTFIKL